MVEAERGMNVGAGHGALASVGEHELAAAGQGAEALGAFGIFTGLTGMRAGRESLWRDMVGAGGKLLIVVLVRREGGRSGFGGILDGRRRRKNTVAVG